MLRIDSNQRSLNDRTSKGNEQDRLQNIEAETNASMMMIDTPAVGATSNTSTAEKVQTKPKSNRPHKHCRHHRRRHPVKSARINPTAAVLTQTEVNHQPIEPTAKKPDAEDRRTIPLQSIENKIVSQRAVLTAETQVGNYQCVACSSPVYDNGCVQHVYYEDDGCYPSSTLDFSSASGIIQQANSCVCLPQQQQQQSLCCTNACSQSYLCSPSYGTAIQQCSVSQPEYICIDSSPSSAAQPTIVNQIPYYASSSGYSPSQQFLCVAQTPTQNATSIIIQQQPQVHAQPVQFIQSPQESAGQYIQISSATPQLIQMTNQNQSSGLQMLSQPAYGSIGASMQNQQQYAIVNTPMPQPVYSQARDNSGASNMRRPVPNMFRNALVRTISNRTGIPVMASSPVGLPPPSGMTHTLMGASRAPNASVLSNDRAPPSSSTSLPIVPLTPGGLLIPFQPTESKTNPFTKTAAYRSSLDRVRHQIQQRSQLLDFLNTQDFGRVAPRPVRIPSPLRRPVPSILSPRAAPFTPAPVFNRVSPPLPLPVSQTPYVRGNIFGSSSSSSSSTSSSRSQARSSSIAPTYTQPSLDNRRTGSTLSGPSASYQTLRP